MIRDEYVERLAQLITSRKFGPRDQTDETFAGCCIMVRDVFLAIEEDAVHGGPKLVEREPNFAMGMAPKSRDTSREKGLYAGVWRSMFDAAPAVPGDDE